MPRTKLLAAAGYGLLAATDTMLASRDTTTARRLRYVTKPLLMPALATSFADSTRGRRDVLCRGTAAAQAFSWGGDVALLGSSERSFLAGVGSFFAAHVCYIAGFVSARRRGGAGARNLNTTGLKAAMGMWASTAPVMAFAAGRKDPMLRGPIAAYSTILAAMFASSTMLDPELPAAARRKAVLGTSLFLLSDSILGTREFVLRKKDPRLEAAVMATYTAGQWLIADGVASARTAST